MDCLKAETAMMHYIEKTLKPTDARDLALHVMGCPPCRELYLVLDDSADMLAAPAQEAPECFTQEVMAQVRALPAYAPAAGNAVLRILWGLSGIVMGVALLFALNPHWLEGTAVQYAFTAMVAFFGDVSAWLGQVEITHALINSGLGIAALVFAALIAALLYGLHRGEGTGHKSVNA
ncbi:MAG: hypothetical protein FWB88_05925 [Defluviitaleaceae bacterium]|nr:hypothetical protein [Defluviitaleaceae bacterium]MCL2240128.1 hypothetical protein [Defluviitaleaceae bacterium]